MIDLSYDFIITLQKEVLRRFGVEVMLPGDCKHLSLSILEATTKLVSETTLKRVFGFAVAQHSFSRYTLNTLSQYCEYKDWEDFQLHHYKELNGAPSVDNSKWSDLKTKADAVSHYTILTLKNRSGISFGHTVHRQYCTAHIERFLESDYAATALIAPAGWGKSVALVHLAEHFWFGKEARYKQDICWFIHAHAAGSLLLKGFSLSSWLDNQLNLGNGENFREYFASHFDKKGGRLILIIDGFDEIAVAGDKLRLLYTKLEDFVYSNDLYPWVKVILSIRSNTWSEIFQHSQQYPAFRRYWYVGPEMDEETNINLPPLTEQEVKAILYNHQFDPGTVRLFSENFLHKLRHPYYLQLFCQLNTGPEQTFVDEHLSLFEIVSKFIQNRVFNSQSNSFKIKIIEKLLCLLDLGRGGQYIDKNLLLNQNADLFPAYKELIADNILVEENLSQEIMFHVKVRFAHNFLLEYFTAMHFIQQSDQAISESMLQKVLEHLPQSPYRVGVFIWLLRYAINHAQTDGIQRMFYLPLSNIEKSHMLEYLVLHYHHEATSQMELKSIFPAGYFKKHPLNHLITDDFIHFRKRKVLNALLTLAEAPEDKLKIRSILFTVALLQLDAEQCELELNNIKKIYTAENFDEDLWITPYEISLFVYEFLKFGIVNEAIKEKLYSYKLYHNKSSREAISVSQEIVYRNMGVAFILLNDHAQLLEFTTSLFESHPSLPHQKTDPFRLMLLCWQAQAHLGLGNTQAAERICKHAEQILKRYASDYFSGKYLESLQKMIYARVYYNEKEFNKAIRTAETAVEVAQKLDFKLLALMNFGLLNKIYQQLHMEKQKHDTLQQIELIRKSTSFKQAVPNFAL
ncbi:NACHT domain-containing protein [Chitinophaga defluvii]|uniref:NACHT domain-containing protein n=1 Tax=Chitinophaga defluvii TaxID=3163343 RepID=A0ABV2TBK9_9BACT